MKHDAPNFTARRISLWHRTMAVLLIPTLCLNAPPVLADLQSDINAAKQAQASSTQKYPAPVTSPTNVKVNKKLPAITPPARTLSFSNHPTDQEIFSHSPFAEPLIPIGAKTTPAEDAALAQALLAFYQRTGRDDYSALENFLTAYPQSAWRISLLTDLGLLYRQTGWYSKSLDVWEEAWALGKKKTSPTEKAVVDRALSELVVLNARVGRIERLGPLFKEINGRTLVGSSREKIAAAKQGYALMVRHPERGYRCGPMAIETFCEQSAKSIRFNKLVKTEPSTVKGTNLAQIYQLGQKLGLGMIMAKRTPGSAILVPSMVNWKVGHFAAIIAQNKGLVRLHDPTFGDDVWVSPQALDAEASGYFLIKNQALPSGWSPVNEAEGQTVWGKGPTTVRNPQCITCPNSQTGSCGGCGGMATYSIYEMLASLSVKDTPLFYQPAYGPSVSFTITYAQRESYQPSTFTYSNLGPLWTVNWLSYIIDDPSTPGADVTQYCSGGGEHSYTGYSGSAYAPQLETGAVLKLTSSTTYELDMPDGSKQIFGTANTSTPRQVFMTETIDAQGRALTYTYDSYYRLTAVTDAMGQVTTISYGSISSSNPAFYQITTVTDPFSRTATLAYNSEGSLQSSTDMNGLVSSYGYGNGVLTTLTTPYGTTTFNCGESSDMNWVQVTDPQGGQERLENWSDQNTNVVAPSSAPSGVDTTYYQYRNTFYWNKKAMLVCAGTLDYTKAQLTEFLHQDLTTMSGIVQCTQAPLESRIWYSYPGQTSGSYQYIGTSDFPSRVARILNDSSTQATSYTYNSLGKILTKTDPAGRVTSYTYDTTYGIDLTQTTQTNGTSTDVLSSATYNSSHQPLTAVDASGQTTTYTYYTSGAATGLIDTITDALGETTTYTYNSSGQLTSITGPVSGSTVSMTYDTYGRLATQTDINGYVTTYGYDLLNRLTLTTYPDGTTDQNVYTNMDITLSKDRLNRWTRTFYNPVRQVIGVLDPQGRVTSYDRCICGELKGIIDPNGHRTSWNCDLEGRVTSKTFADGSGYAYTYDTGYTSELMSVTDPKSQVANYTYNHDGTLSQVAYADSTINYSYDTAYLRLTGVSKTVGANTYATGYSYYPVYTSGALITGGGRLETETGPLGSTAAITYTYDALGRATGTSINDSGGANASSWGFDSLGRMTSASNALGSFTYGYAGVTPRLTSVSYPTGQSTTYTYQTGSTQDYRLTDITNYLTGTTVLSKFDYTYNANGTIATWQEQADSNTPTLWTYGYDKADQLLSATQTNTSTSAVLAQYVYGYDLAGNRTSDQVGLGVTQASYNNLNQLSGCSGGGLLQFAGTLSKPAQVTVAGNVATSGNYYSTNFTGLASVTAGTNTVAVIAHDVNGNTATNSYQVVVPSGSTVSPSYDLDGNMTNNGAGQTYTWDSQNGLASITYSTGSNSGNHTEFTYDALGRRINIVELTGTSIGSGTVISTKQYVWVGNTIAEERASNVTTVTKRFFPQGEQQSGTAYYYTSDHLGSVRELVNSSGTLLSRYAYDPYGVVTTTHSAGNTSTPPIDATFQYTGDYLHAASGLNLTKFRAYDPNTARWLSRDPLQDAERSQGPNLYDYVQNNPVNAIDPDGLCTCQSGKWTGTGTAKQGGSGIVVLSGISGTFTGTVTCTSDSSLTATVSGTVGGAGSLFLAVGWSQDFGLTASGSDASSLAGYGVFATISAGKSLGGKVGKYLWTNLNLNLVGAAPGQNVTLSGGPQTNTPTPFGAYMFTWRITQSH